MTTELTIAPQQSLSSEDVLNQSISPYEYERVCCRNCCIKERRRATNDQDDDNKHGQDDNENEHEFPDENLTLSEDIWTLAYVIARNRGALPVSYCILISVIYIIQIVSLMVMIWGFSTTINYDVITKYEMEAECESFDIFADFTNADSTTSLKCDTVSLIEHPGSTQEYVDLTYPNPWTWDSAHPLLFGLAVVLSWFLLSIYTLKTFTNPIMMMIIGYQYTKVEVTKKGCRRHVDFNAMHPRSNCSNCCSSLSDLLYGIAWANVILSIVSYATGFIILIGYPVYFGIDSPTDIILTPIGIVFILEIDDWAFEFVKSFYVERQMEDLWTFSKSDFNKKESFGNLNALLWRRMIVDFSAFNFILMASTFYWTSSSDSYELSTDLVSNAFSMGYYGVGSASLLLFAAAWRKANCNRCVLKRCKCRSKLLIVYKEGSTRSAEFNSVITN